jgi:hypothetical protein
MMPETLFPNPVRSTAVSLPVVPEHAPEKPREGQPCNGCGYCCAAEVCRVGLAVYGKDTPAPCPAITFHDGRFWCGVVESATPKMKPIVELVLGVGFGCDATDFD